MHTSNTTTSQANQMSSVEESKPGFRTKTIATRLTPDELVKVESAAEHAGKPLSEWLRETALTATKQHAADPVELVLAELWAMRYTLLSLFHAGALATMQGKPLLPDSVLKIRDKSDREKLEQARRMLVDFLARAAKVGGEER